jgi:uncharacterized SAM-binding protein YcdF (DUF218 family)
MTVGAATLALTAWLMLGGPVLVDRLLVEDDAPAPAAAIVCVTGGLTWHNLPVDDGWRRIYTAVQLHVDKFAPVVVFSGGGTGTVSEAEVYAEVAGWFGLPESGIAFDPTPGGTNEHPRNLLRLAAPRLTTSSPLLIVTSPLHARRVALCFRKAGYSNFRMVTSYTATRDGAPGREGKRSLFENFQASGKRYDDPINRLKWGLDTLLTTIRECAAIGVYKARGWI